MREAMPSRFQTGRTARAAAFRRALVAAGVSREAEAITRHLEAHGYAAVHEHSSEGAFFRALTERFDVILLDLLAPTRSSVEVVSAMRTQGVRTPVLVLTPPEAIQARVRVLEAGATGCLLKPFAIAEFLERMRGSQVRRLRLARSRR